jgi:hypothetical protein
MPPISRTVTGPRWCSTERPGRCSLSFVASSPTPDIKVRASPRRRPTAATGSSKSSDATTASMGSPYYPSDGSLSAPLRGSIAAEGSPKTGSVSTERASPSCAWLPFASCCEGYAIPYDVPGQTLRVTPLVIDYCFALRLCKRSSLLPAQVAPLLSPPTGLASWLQAVIPLGRSAAHWQMSVDVG